MRYFARLNDNGNIVVVFKGKNERDKRKDTIEITEEIYNQWKTHKNWILNNGQLIEPQQPVPTLSEAKTLKLVEIKNSFQNAMKNGVIDFTIPSTGIPVQVDARRSNHNNDLQNVEGLIEIMQLQNITEIAYKCYDNTNHTMTISDLQSLRLALIQQGLQLYQKKHTLEEMVNSATTIEEVNNILW